MENEERGRVVYGLSFVQDGIAKMAYGCQKGKGRKGKRRDGIKRAEKSGGNEAEWESTLLLKEVAFERKFCVCLRNVGSACGEL